MLIVHYTCTYARLACNHQYEGRQKNAKRMKLLLVLLLIDATVNGVPCLFNSTRCFGKA
jgi:hypothetical protein